MSRPTLKSFKKKVLNDPKSKMLYDELQWEYQILEEMLNTRKTSGLTQEQIAERMGTKKANISRLESNIVKPSPTLLTLQRYASAMDCHIELRFVHNQHSA